LDHWGPMARSAVPALAKLLKDPEEQLALFADIALWGIDRSAALREGGWKPFRSDDWKFTVMLPSEPEHTEQPFLFGFILMHSFMAMHKAGPFTSATSYRFTGVVASLRPPFGAHPHSGQPVLVGW
jgi:hypothetical protein